MSLFKSSREKSTKQLMGIDAITGHSLTTRQGDLVFFIIAPTNISVLPEDSIEARINALLNIIRGVDGIELMATDSMQSFEPNKRFYREWLSAPYILLYYTEQHVAPLPVPNQIRAAGPNASFVCAGYATCFMQPCSR